MSFENRRRIDEIRHSLSVLEEIKDSIAGLLGEQTQLSTSQQQMWVTDIKEVYYSCIAAWQMLDGASKGQTGNAVSCRQFLTAAKSRMEQSASEIRSLDNILALWVESDLRLAFEDCYEQISDVLERFETKAEARIPGESIVRTSPITFELRCFACGEKAATFAMDTPKAIGQEDDKEKLVYSGICTAAHLDPTDKRKVFRWLERGNLAAIHDHIKQFRVTEDGLDAYCPECDRIYCRTHYNVIEEWDEGFYDYATGTCPVGHTRIIDD